MSLKEYYQLLNSHNWRYTMMDGDDPGAYARAAAAHVRVQNLAKTSKRHQFLYEAFCNFIYRNSEKPLEPDD